MRMEQEKLITPGEAASLFGVDPKTMTRWAKKGLIRSTKTLGGHRRFYYTDILRLRAADGFALPEKGSNG